MSQNSINYEYNAMLQILIPRLEEFKSKKENYFVAGVKTDIYYPSQPLDNFIVRKITTGPNDHHMHETFFDEYCEEMKSFHDLGYNVPDIYAWMRVPGNREYQFYILEEKPKGKVLNYPSIDDYIDSIYSDRVTREVMHDTINNPLGKCKTFLDLVGDYVDYYLINLSNLNESIDSDNSKELEAFINGLYEMYMKANYSYPEIIPQNVYVANPLNPQSQKISLGENPLSNRRYKKDIDAANNFIINRLVSLVLTNKYNKYGYGDLNLGKIEKIDKEGKISSKVNSSTDVAENVIRKIITAMNKVLDNPALTDRSIYVDLRDRLVAIFGQKKTKDILGDVNINLMQ